MPQRLSFARRAFLIATCVGLSPLAAYAVPAPVPEDELRAQSDLIVEVDVRSVRRAADGYVAELHVRRVEKGRLPSQPLPYSFHAPTPGLLGERNESVFAGQHLRMFLVFERGGYRLWATNGAEPLSPFPSERFTLPHRPGEIVFADGRRGVAAVPACRTSRGGER